MKKLFLHVGPHKTGTTLIQKFLLDNSAELFKSNIVYPKRFMTFFGHHDFRDKADKKLFTAEDIDFINNNDHDWLLSSENFISLNQSALEYIKAQFNNKKIVIIYSWRRSSYKLFSIWQEEIKHGKTVSFHEYYHEHLARPGASAMLAPDVKLNIYSQIFGKNNIKILDYDTSLKNNSLLADFCALVGVGLTERFVGVDGNPQARNESLEDTDVEILRALNYKLKPFANKNGAEIRNQYLNSRKELQELGLPELKNIVKKCSKEYRIGDYLIDIRSEKIMSEKYLKNIVNYEPNLESRKVSFPSSEWAFNAKSHKLLERIAAYLREKLKG